MTTASPTVSAPTTAFRASVDMPILIGAFAKCLARKAKIIGSVGDALNADPDRIRAAFAHWQAECVECESALRSYADMHKAETTHEPRLPRWKGDADGTMEVWITALRREQTATVKAANAFNKRG